MTTMKSILSNNISKILCIIQEKKSLSIKLTVRSLMLNILVESFNTSAELASERAYL